VNGPFLGVDGGGSGTRFVLVGADGVVLAEASGPTTYTPTGGSALVREVLAAGVAEVCAAAGTRPADVAHAFCGLPGYGESPDGTAPLDDVVVEVLGHDRCAADNDMVCGWAGSLAGADGVNVIAGTGSMAYGRRGDRGARVGGWGEVFGDEGSGHAVAVAGLRLFSRMADGREPAGPLLDVVRDHLDLRHDLDLVGLVHERWGADRGRVAALAPLVGRAARAGDAAARRVLQDAGGALAELVATARGRLGHDPDEVVPVSWSGGLLADDVVRAALLEGLRGRGGRYEPRPPALPPVLGAALHAAALAGTPLDDAALARLRTSSAAPPERGHP